MADHIIDPSDLPITANNLARIVRLNYYTEGIVGRWIHDNKYYIPSDWRLFRKVGLVGRVLPSVYKLDWSASTESFTYLGAFIQELEFESLYDHYEAFGNRYVMTEGTRYHRCFVFRNEIELVVKPDPVLKDFHKWLSAI